jgi:hypothetical protein
MRTKIGRAAYSRLFLLVVLDLDVYNAYGPADFHKPANRTQLGAPGQAEVVDAHVDRRDAVPEFRCDGGMAGDIDESGDYAAMNLRPTRQPAKLGTKR